MNKVKKAIIINIISSLIIAFLVGLCGYLGGYIWNEEIYRAMAYGYRTEYTITYTELMDIRLYALINSWTQFFITFIISFSICFIIGVIIIYNIKEDLE